MDGRRFRHDINGLRALAVLGVVAFHFHVGPLRAGGFGGVDVFFVVSGFLMTQIICAGLDKNKFSLLAFWGARVRRIVPALVVLVGCVVLAGLVLLNPLKVTALSERAIWSLLFLSNILFAKQGTYFVAPDQNWVLHTWSLSVEWQFYMVFPLLLAGLRIATGRRWVAPAILALGAIASVAAMQWSLHAGGAAGIYNFYMLWTRAWEFIVGALVAYGVASAVPLPRALRIAVHYAGLAAIVATMLFVHENTTPWPSLMTMVPVLGTAAVLLGGHDSPRWATCAPVRAVGLWSYSVYLWHWPVAAISSYFGYWSLAWRLAGAVASVPLGVASYELIERRATTALWTTRRRVWRTGFAATAVLASLLVLSFQTSALEALKYGSDPVLQARLRELRGVERDMFDKNYCGGSESPASLLWECRNGDLASNDVLVIGDSFTGELEPRYADLKPGSGFGIAFLEHGACMPVDQTKYMDLASVCDRWTAQMYRYVERSTFKRVVFIAFWPTYVQNNICLMTEPNCGLDLDHQAFEAALDRTYERMGRFWRKLTDEGKEVVVFGLVPFPDKAADPLAVYNMVAAGHDPQTLDISYDAFMKRYGAIARRLQAAAAFAHATYVDPGAALCPGGKCPVVRNGRPLYADEEHFRASMMKDPRFAVYDRYLLPAAAATGTAGKPTDKVAGDP